MRAVLTEGFGGPEVLHVGTTDVPGISADQILIGVSATSVNRPDIIQRQGHYPPPKGESEILGLEVSGTVAAIGEDVERFAVGDRVLALVAGGGYAQYVAAYADHAMPMPDRLSFEQAACICETYITAYMNLFRGARLADGETALLHGGGGGVNTAAIQLCKTLIDDCRVIVTASPAKCERVAALGVDCVIDYRHEDFADAVLSFTDRRGADVILDHIGAAYFDANLKALARGGRLAIIATMGGREAALDLGRLMVKCQTVMGSVLRSRPVPEKAEIIEDFEKTVMPLFDGGVIEPLIDRVMPLDEIAQAHRIMERSRHFGKLVVSVGA